MKEENLKSLLACNYMVTNHHHSFCAIIERKLCAISLERIDRSKKSPRRFWNKIFREDTKEQWIYYEKILEYLWEEELWKINDFIDVPQRIQYIFRSIRNHSYREHHVLHAASAFYPSYFSESAILVVDWYWMTYKKFVSQSCFYGNQNNLKMLSYDYLHYNKSEHYYGIGFTYSLFSTILELEEGTLMGLASYWDMKKYKDIEIFDAFWGMRVNLSQKFFLGMENFTIDDGRKKEKCFMEYFKRNFEKIFSITSDDYKQKKKDITKSKFADIAAKLQYETEKAMVYLANYAYEQTGSKNLCLAWWVALNINANTRILKETPFENIFVQPAATDDGLSLWSAYYSYHTRYPHAPRIPMINASLGKQYSDKEILHTLLKYQDKITYRYDPESYKYAAEQIADNKVIGWFYAGSEFGPRALWNRSILANSSSLGVRDRVNDLKRRQRWRPLAPMLLEEDLDEFFEDGIPNYFMTTIGTVRKKKKEEVQWVVHIDGTARYQTINEEQNEKTYKLLKELKVLKWNSVIINTSFNTRWEPIVETPEDALRMFLSCGLDVLILENFIVSKDTYYPQYIFHSEKHIEEEKKKYK